VPREKVQFLTRTNPADLVGKAGADRIELKWSPPFQAPRRYKVYLKSGEGDFKIAKEPGSPAATLEELKSNTRYRVKVTTVDNEGAETLPSNIIEVTTKNYPPTRPGNLSLPKIPGGKEASPARTLK
jgi:hypothetical protein